MWVCRGDSGVEENRSPWHRGVCQAVQQPGLLDLREGEAPGEPMRSAPQLKPHWRLAGNALELTGHLKINQHQIK